MRELSSVETASFLCGFDLVIMDDVDYIGDEPNAGCNTDEPK
jgi:predicted nucleotide-binding protein (sugar kinase/HSP70/actin superfamily)